jgi:hypothetical protein
MRILLAAVAALIASATVGPATAVEYPWCVHYSMNGEARNCGFASWEQCRMTSQGTGQCVQNPFYVAARADAPAARKKIRQSRH